MSVAYAAETLEVVGGAKNEVAVSLIRAGYTVTDGSDAYVPATDGPAGASVFVTPAAWVRTQLEEIVRIVSAAGCDAVFTPSVAPVA